MQTTISNMYLGGIDMTKIDVISGFLGAGKTTLIKKLLSEVLSGEQVVLIENEFGEIGIDGGFLKEAGIEIREMNSGCICCTLVGDFEASLKEVLHQYHPDRIIIEPSGVGKLSDVVRAISVLGDEHDAQFGSAVAVVDASKAKMYMKNFGEFYNDQIQTAGTIILSRTGNMKQEKIQQAIELLRTLNDHSTIITTPWDDITGAQIMEAMTTEKDSLAAKLLAEMEEEAHEHHHHHHHDDDDQECCCGHHHDHDHDEDEDEEHEHHHHHHHDDDDEECCGHHHHDHHGHHHHHHADEVFQSIGMETIRKFTKEEIASKLAALEDEDTYGLILRAKGMVANAEADTWIHFDYVPEETEIRDGHADVTGKIVVIGANVKEDAVRALFA